jgi:hypothetical protein
MTKVARRKFLKGMGVAGLGAASASVAAPAIAQSTPEIKWRQTTSWPKSLDTLYGGADLIGKRVAAMTDNKFQIQTFAGGEIVPGLQVLDAVQNGSVECGHTALYYYFGKDDTFVFASALPFGMNSRMQNAWMTQGGGLDLLNEFLKGYNCYGMPGGNTGHEGSWAPDGLTSRNREFDATDRGDTPTDRFRQIGPMSGITCRDDLREGPSDADHTSMIAMISSASLSGTQRELLHPPVTQLPGVDLVRIPAVNRVYGSKLLH